MSFFSELKRRNVYRVAAVYIIVGWMVLQVVDVFTEFMPLPEWTARLVFVLLAAGLPVALVLAWAIELTPEGLKLETPAPDGVGLRGRGDAILALGVVAILAFGAWKFLGPRAVGTAEAVDVRSLVVLPLENLMEDPSQAYFVEGMHEALTTELSKIEGLRVISRTSAMKYRDSDMSVPEIGQELGVDAVIEGSVLRAGETVRVTAQLIAAQDDEHMWADNFDRELTDILALYADVTTQIAGQIRRQIRPAQAETLENTPQVDPAGYELYLRGSYLCDQWGPQEMAEGVVLMRRAVAVDPGYPPAQAGLAICLQYAAFFSYMPPRQVEEEARRAAERAVELDPTSAEAWSAFAGVRYYLEYDHVASELALERALSLNPSNVRALTHLSWQLGEAGRTAEAIQLARRVRDLDPFQASSGTALPQAYFLGRNFPTALDEYRALVELDPADPSLRYFLGWALEAMGDFPEAVEAHRAALELSGGAPLYRSGLARALALAGEELEAGRILDDLETDPTVDPTHLAMAQIPMGRTDAALTNLERAYEARSSYMLYIRKAPQFDPLRDSDRFQEILERMGW